MSRTSRHINTRVDRFRFIEIKGHTTMTTSMGMYSLRRVVDLPAMCPQSESMYKMRSIHEERRDDRCRRHDAADIIVEDAETPDDTVVTQAPLPEYGALEARQEKILGQLSELKKQVFRLCHFLKQSQVGPVEPTKDLVAVEKPINKTIVLHVDSSKPPYSILALQQLWKDTSISVASFMHNPEGKPNSMPITFHKRSASTEYNNIRLTLIWKEIANLEFILDVDSYPIIGEGNFLRYMSRLIESHNYENTCSQPHTLDTALDLVNVLHYKKCIKEGLLELASTFPRWSCKGGFNIADIAVWSLIKQYPETNLPPPLKKWYRLCEEAFLLTID